MLFWLKEFGMDKSKHIWTNRLYNGCEYTYAIIICFLMYSLYKCGVAGFDITYFSECTKCDDLAAYEINQRKYELRSKHMLDEFSGLE